MGRVAGVVRWTACIRNRPYGQRGGRGAFASPVLNTRLLSPLPKNQCQNEAGSADTAFSDRGCGHGRDHGCGHDRDRGHGHDCGHDRDDHAQPQGDDNVYASASVEG